jgi:hypothetical protein
MMSTGALDSTASRDPRGSRGSGKPSRRPRWLETTIGLLLIGAVGVVGLAASPALLRAAGLTRTSTTARMEFGHPDRNSIPGVDERSARGGFVFSFEDEEEEENPNPPNGWPGQRSPERSERPRVRRDDPGAADTSRPRSEVRMGFSRKELKLFDQPAAGAAVTATVKEGEVVMILKEQGGWALVVHSPEMGWARLSEIAVR